MLLFVYGTLRRDAANHRQMRDARFVARARTTPSYELVDMGGYPAILEGGRTSVVGEVYEVADTLLRQLDAFEEVPELYERKRVSLERGGLARDSLGLVDAYVMTRERAELAPRVLEGDWLSAAVSGENRALPHRDA